MELEIRLEIAKDVVFKGKDGKPDSILDTYRGYGVLLEDGKEYPVAFYKGYRDKSKELPILSKIDNKKFTPKGFYISRYLGDQKESTKLGETSNFNIFEGETKSGKPNVSVKSKSCTLGVKGADGKSVYLNKLTAFFGNYYALRGYVNDPEEKNQFGNDVEILTLRLDNKDNFDFSQNPMDTINGTLLTEMLKQKKDISNGTGVDYELLFPNLDREILPHLAKDFSYFETFNDNFIKLSIQAFNNR